MTAIEQFQGQSLMAQAEMLSKSGIVPKAFRGKPADVLAACLWGAEIGLGPMASMGYIDVIDGNPTLNTEGRMALVRRAGHSVVIEADDQHATVTGKRRDTGDAQTVTFTIAMAQRAGLAGKQVWKAYPEAMLTSRALSQLCRNLFPDVMMGMSYAPEEAASFAAPGMLDNDAAELAQRTSGALPSADNDRGGDSPTRKDGVAGDRVGPSTGAGPTKSPPRQLPPPNVDGNTGEIIDVTTQSPPTRAFPPPGQRTTADNTRDLMRELEEPFKDAESTLAPAPDVRDLMKTYGALDADAKAAYDAAITDAGVSWPKSPKAVLIADYAKLYELMPEPTF